MLIFFFFEKIIKTGWKSSRILSSPPKADFLDIVEEAGVGIGCLIGPRERGALGYVKVGGNPKSSNRKQIAVRDSDTMMFWERPSTI